ncbi:MULTISPECIES: toxin-antitoxin system YwqK family antitoxin [Fusobacterium]|uniref:toxin-antitoxin system YwqK family antitoxin n=1 Tax=Fusobacterium TaxID=848 RepID=UPI001476822D|nr:MULTISPECIES: hypothetical protein [Fusobacterium]NME36479.1 hypothetical protein [Fusobacterium sp. FSA-380-WT-3A]
MKKIFKIIIIILLFSLTACGVSSSKAKRALHKHFIERYKEPFVVEHVGRRSDGKEEWYEAQVFPAKYIGTPRQYDKYYYSKGNVDIKKGIFGESIDFVGDLYRLVILNESANEFYEKKLKELFGEYVLPIFYIDVGSADIFPKYEETLKEKLENDEYIDIKGNIIIFGRIKNKEDEQKYKEKIFQFVTFVKEQGIQEKVSINFEVVDERILAKDALSYINKLEKRENIDEDFKILDEAFENTPEENKKAKIDNFSKSEIYTQLNRYGAYLLSTRIVGKEYLKNNIFLLHQNADSLFLAFGICSMPIEIFSNSKRCILPKEIEYNSVDDLKFNIKTEEKEIEKDGKTYYKYYLNDELVWEKVLNNELADYEYENFYKNGELYLEYKYIEKRRNFYKNGKVYKNDVILPNDIELRFENNILKTITTTKYSGKKHIRYLLDNNRVREEISSKIYEKLNPTDIWYSKDNFLALDEKDSYFNSGIGRIKDGENIEYFFNKKENKKSQIKIKTFYKDGLLDGNYEEYFPNGNIKIKCSYKKGFLDGEYKEYSVDGKLEKEYIYKNGVIIK